MWWAGNKVHDVYLGTRAIAVCQGARVLHAAPAETFDAVAAAFDTWLDGAPKRARLRLWLSGGLCRPFLAPALDGVKTSAERLKVAHALATQRTGLQGECQVWVESGSDGEATVAVAIQAAELDRINAAVAGASQKAKVLSIRPWWSEVLRHALQTTPNLAVLGIQDCDSMTVLVGQGGRYEIASTYSPVNDEPTARSTLLRALTSVDGIEGVEMGGRLALQHQPRAVPGPDIAIGALAEFSR